MEDRKATKTQGGGVTRRGRSRNRNMDNEKEVDTLIQRTLVGICHLPRWDFKSRKSQDRSKKYL